MTTVTSPDRGLTGSDGRKPIRPNASISAARVLIAKNDAVEGGEPQLVGGDYQGEETGTPLRGGGDTVVAVDDVERTGEEVPHTWIHRPEPLAYPTDLGLDQW